MPRKKKVKAEFPAQEQTSALLTAAPVETAQTAITEAREQKALTDQREPAPPDQAFDSQPLAPVGEHTAAVLETANAG